MADSEAIEYTPDSPIQQLKDRLNSHIKAREKFPGEVFRTEELYLLLIRGIDEENLDPDEAKYLLAVAPLEIDRYDAEHKDWIRLIISRLAPLLTANHQTELLSVREALIHSPSSDFAKLLTGIIETPNVHFARFYHDYAAHLNKQAKTDLINTVSDITASLDALSKKIEHEQERINTQKSEINFVELNKAFQKLIDDKKKELFWPRLLSPIILICLAIIPITILYSNIKVTDVYDAMRTFLPITACEFFLLYYQRLVFQEYKSLKAQIAQLEIRSAACQFIENYRKFAVEHPVSKTEDGKETTSRFNLEKFESLIFGGIAVDPTAVPTVFDGVEQLGKLIEAVKK